MPLRDPRKHPDQFQSPPRAGVLQNPAVPPAPAHRLPVPFRGPSVPPMRRATAWQDRALPLGRHAPLQAPSRIAQTPGGP